MKVYIAGPMTGYPEFNQKAFAEAEQLLMQAGFEPVNPATAHGEDLDGTTGDEKHSQEELREIIRTDLDLLQGCGAIRMLKGWEKSLGARAEHAVAVWMGLEVWYE